MILAFSSNQMCLCAKLKIWESKLQRGRSGKPNSQITDKQSLIKISGSKFSSSISLFTPETMFQDHDELTETQHLASLKPTHFADLIRTAQLVFDPAGGVSGRYINVDWQQLGIPDNVAENLKSLGKKYRYASPHIASDIIWSQLTPATRTWFIKHKDELWKFEEIFPALDED